MSITVRLGTPFREVTRGKGEVEAQGADLMELFDGLEKQYPGFREMVFENDRTIRQYAHIFINGEDYRPLGGLSAPLEGGDMVAVLFAISGG